MPLWFIVDSVKTNMNRYQMNLRLASCVHQYMPNMRAAWPPRRPGRTLRRLRLCVLPWLPSASRSRVLEAGRSERRPATRECGAKGHPVHGPALPAGFLRVWNNPEWIGFLRIAAGLNNRWVGLVQTVWPVYMGSLHCFAINPAFIIKHRVCFTE